MKVVFSGFESPVEVACGSATVMEILNPALFARVALALQGGMGPDSPEPYTVWDGDVELNPRNAFLFVSDPLNLPWDSSQLMGEVVKRIEREFLADEDLRHQVELAEQMLSSSLFSLSSGLDSSYGFGAEWDFRRYLKLLGFGAMVQTSDSFLDNLMNFLSLVLDSRCNKVLVFVNLKTFLTENELVSLYEHLFYTQLPMLLLENKPDGADYQHEKKTVIDLDFLEF